MFAFVSVLIFELILCLLFVVSCLALALNWKKCRLAWRKRSVQVWYRWWEYARLVLALKPVPNGFQKLKKVGYTHMDEPHQTSPTDSQWICLRVLLLLLAAWERLFVHGILLICLVNVSYVSPRTFKKATSCCWKLSRVLVDKAKRCKNIYIVYMYPSWMVCEQDSCKNLITMKSQSSCDILYPLVCFLKRHTTNTQQLLFGSKSNK